MYRLFKQLLVVGALALPCAAAGQTPTASADTIPGVMKNGHAAQPAAFPGGMLALQTRHHAVSR